MSADSLFAISYALGTRTSLILDDGAAAVALTRTKTVIEALPIALRGILDPVTDVQVVPPLRLYSIELDTPVIAFWALVNTAFGAPERVGTVTVIVADTKAVSVAARRT